MATSDPLVLIPHPTTGGLSLVSARQLVRYLDDDTDDLDEAITNAGIDSCDQDTQVDAAWVEQIRQLNNTDDARVYWAARADH